MTFKQLRILSVLFSLCIFMHNTFAAENFSQKDLNGVTHSIAGEKGKWIIMNYWATWCPPCLKEIPELIKFHEKHKNTDAIVWGINIEKIPRATLDSFLKKLNIPYPIFVSPMVNFTYFEPLRSLPVTYFISPEGNLFKSHVGKLTLESLEKTIQGKTTSN